jgi:hypothetical protein
MSSKTGPPMKLLGSRQLPLLLVFTLLLCHGVFGALHLVCYPPQCAGDAEHAADHQSAAGAVSGVHEHPAGHHGTSIGYFAVLVGLLGLFLELLPKGALLRVGLGMPWTAVLRRLPAAFRPPPTPTPIDLQVFRL